MNQAPPRSLQLQERAARTLAHGSAGGTHAWLLSGPAGAGTVDAARWLAARALCPVGGGDDCSTCQRVLRGVHPDLHWVRAEGVELAIEQARELVEQLTLKPFEAARQVAVIEDADTLGATNAAAGNALLKVIEEPPGDVVFVLLATRPAQVLATIRSRVVEVPFPPLSDEVLAAELEHALADGSVQPGGLEPAVAVRAARGDLGRLFELVSGGPALERRRLAATVAHGLTAASLAPHDAADMLGARIEQVRAGEEERAREQLEAIAERLPDKEAARFRNSREADGMDRRVRRRGRRAQVDELRSLVEELMTWYRDLLVVRAGAANAVLGVDRTQALEQLAQSAAAERAVAALDALEDLHVRAAANVDLAVTLAALCAELASLAENRVRSRRTLGAGARSPQGYELSLG